MQYRIDYRYNHHPCHTHTNMSGDHMTHGIHSAAKLRLTRRPLLPGPHDGERFEKTELYKR